MITIQQIERFRSPFYKAFIPRWRDLLYKQAQPFINALNDPNAINYIQTIPIDIKETRELFLKTWIITGKFFAIQNQSEHKKSISCPIHTKAIPEEEYFERYMYNFAENEAGDRIVSIIATNKEAIIRNIRKSIQEAEIEGWGAEQTARFIQDNLREEMTLISRYSAERIARTEIVGASNRGQLAGAQSLGYNMNKTWIPYIDSRTRTFEKGMFNHAISETVGLYDDFQKTGEPMQHPGDPKGSAGNVCNCRCTCGYNVL